MAPNQQINKSITSQTSEKLHTLSKKEILYDGHLYDVTDFLHRHSGGDKIILNFTGNGEDATLAIQQFHNRSIDKVLKMLKTLPNRREPEYELSIEMEQARAKNAEMTADFLKLHQELKDEGMFEPSIPHWINRFVEIIALGLLGYSLIMHTTGSWTRFLGIYILNISMTRGGWMLHEFGHLSATGNPKVDRFFNAILAGFRVGLSGKWWRLHHSKHHAMTNRVTLDPDIDLLPGFIVFNEKTMNDVKQDQTILHRYQEHLILPAMVALYFQWVFWKAPIGIIKNKSLVEVSSLMGYWYIMYQIGFYSWLLTTVFFATYLFGNTALSHTYLPVVEGPMHWIEYTFQGTLDIEHRPWCDWWMGYLNYQIEHHLFPTLPQFRSPLIKDRVMALAEKHGLPYHICSYKDAVKNTFLNVKSISHFLKSID